MYCQTLSGGEFSVAWYKDNKLLKNIDTYLHIITAKVEDIGVFKCEIFHNGQRKKSEVAIHVFVYRKLTPLLQCVDAR